MLQDKIHHSLIKINKLTSDKESIKYIVPLYFNAIKYIYDNCTHVKIDPFLIEQVSSKFRSFYDEIMDQLNSLDQVHTYMVEECIEMLEARHVQAKSELKKSRLMSKLIKEDEHQLEEEMVVIPQETYYLDEYFQKDRPEAQSGLFTSSKKLIRALSMDEVPNFQHSKLEVDNMWDSLQKYYEEHRLDEAYELCQKFQNGLFLCDPNSKLTTYKQDFIEQIHEQMEIMTYYYQFFNEPGYTFDKEEDGVSMYYKVVEDIKEVSIRIQAQLDISIQRFLCIVSEVDLFQEFVPFSYDTKQLKEVSRNQKIGTTKVFVPLLSNREAYFFASAYDRLKTHNSIFFYSRTINNDTEFQKKLNFPVTMDPDLVELSYKFYIMEYSPIGPCRGKIRLATNIDMRIGFLPLFVINKSLRIFAFDYFSNLMEVNRKFQGSAWQKKMEQRPYIYNFFKHRIQEYLQNLNGV